MPATSRRLTLLVIALGVAVLPLVVYRLFLGIDFTDESYYLAVALRFVRGDIPFVDELFVNQSAILIVLPFYRVLIGLFGTEALVLHARLLYFAFTLFVAWTGYLALEPRAGRLNAFLASLVAVAFIPLNIPGLSYNTLGGGLFAAGLFLGHAASRRRTIIWYVGSGVMLGLSAFAYPPLVFASLFVQAILVTRAEGRRLPTAIGLIAAQAAALVAFFPHFARAGEALGRSVLYSLTGFDHGGGPVKWLLVARDLFLVNPVPRALGGALALAVAIVLRRRAPRMAAASLALTLPFLYLGYAREIFPVTWAATYFALGAATVARADGALAFEVLLPSLVAGILTAWTSMSSVANAVIGMWAAIIVASALFAGACARLARSPLAGTASQLLVLAVLLLGLFRGKVFYGDGEYARLTARVPSGPFRGLFTTPEKLRYLEEVTRDVTALENRDGRILFYEFPAGYLLTRMRSGAPESWIRTVARRKDFYVRYYAEHLTPGNLVFAFHRLDFGYPSPVTYASDDPLVAFVRGTHRPILHRENYDVFAPRASGRELKASLDLPRRIGAERARR